MRDTIIIRRLRVSTHIGVPDEERAQPQTLWITLRLTPIHGFDDLADDITRTVDYHAVAVDIASLSAAKPRRLIESLAVEIADHLLNAYPLDKVFVEIEKHILPDTECVAVKLVRERVASQSETQDSD
ncbi:dihydroneopterin aldolase [Luteolibacter pohnpeiensis]|uniref:dihydroneopterin aldolase n=1 Tax=Luteolibacter pohnpeiensis TaxID=454153 RepID=A0A934SA90_9BACT|nr:dihydroneopterin aldolase [Luteolibacter pohnpeiensis]MBK1883741.1 dihydroneopterin aldolase [Luteolibacter pohnpeiensis]